MTTQTKRVVILVVSAVFLLGVGVSIGRKETQQDALPSNPNSPNNATHAPLSSDQLERAKAFDEELSEIGRTNDRAGLAGKVLTAQQQLGKSGYGTKFTGEVDLATRAALRAYQGYNHLEVTGSLNGETIVSLDADEEALHRLSHEAWDFLPIMRFPDYGFSSSFVINGLFRDTSGGQLSNPIRIDCTRDQGVCLVVESTPTYPSVGKLLVQEWTDDRIVAREAAECYTDQLRIEREAKTVTYTTVRTQASCSLPFAEAIAGKPIKLPSYTEELLIDGSSLIRERIDAYMEADRRINRVSPSFKALVDSESAKAAAPQAKK